MDIPRARPWTQMLVVHGDLVVSGLLADCLDPESLIVVTGDLRAGNLITTWIRGRWQTSSVPGSRRCAPVNQVVRPTTGIRIAGSGSAERLAALPRSAVSRPIRQVCRSG
jgi:hypothetical protein